MEETEETLAGVALEETLASVDIKGGTSADELAIGLQMFFAGLPLLPGIAEITLRFWRLDAHHQVYLLDCHSFSVSELNPFHQRNMTFQ